MPKILIGNRCHLAFKRQVSEDEAEEYALKHDMTFFEVSPLCDFNVTESLMELARVALKRNGMSHIWGPMKGQSPQRPSILNKIFSCVFYRNFLRLLLQIRFFIQYFEVLLELLIFCEWYFRITKMFGLFDHLRFSSQSPGAVSPSDNRSHDDIRGRPFAPSLLTQGSPALVSARQSDSHHSNAVLPPRPTRPPQDNPPVGLSDELP